MSAQPAPPIDQLRRSPLKSAPAADARVVRWHELNNRRVTATLLPWALLLATLAAAGCERRDDAIAIVGATVVVGQDLEATSNVNIVVRNGRIVCVDLAERCPADGVRQTIDAGGRWIIPGLFDFHTHVAEYSYMPWSPLFLAHGVTSLRDVGGRTDSSLALRRRWQGEQPGPNLFIAGHPIDGDPTHWPDPFPDVPWTVQTPEEARDSVRRAKALGVDFIKLYNALSPATLEAATAEARDLGLKVTADLWYWNASTSIAIAAGVSGMEHAIAEQITIDFPADRRPERRPQLLWGRDDDQLEALVDQIVKHEVVLTTTMAVLAHEGRGFPEQKPTFQVLPTALQDMSRRWWAVRDSSEDVFFRDVFPEQMCRTVMELHARGGRLAAGTDAFFHVAYPGDIHDELRFLQGCGLTPRETLAAATTTPSAWLGADSLGSLRAGAVADFVALFADPFLDIENTRRIDFVVRRGVLLRPDKLLTAAQSESLRHN